MSQKQKVILLSLLLLAVISLTVLAIRLVDQANANAAFVDWWRRSEAEGTQVMATINSIYATSTAMFIELDQTATAAAR